MFKIRLSLGYEGIPELDEIYLYNNDVVYIEAIVGENIFAKLLTGKSKGEVVDFDHESLVKMHIQLVENNTLKRPSLSDFISGEEMLCKYINGIREWQDCEDLLQVFTLGKEQKKRLCTLVDVLKAEENQDELDYAMVVSLL
jgi:hypothetical protein